MTPADGPIITIAGIKHRTVERVGNFRLGTDVYCAIVCETIVSLEVKSANAAQWHP